MSGQSERLFNAAPDLRLNGDLEGEVYESRTHISIAEPHGEGVMLNITEAYALRDWLNQVLP